MVVLPVDLWSAFKALAASKQLGLHYIEYDNRYELYLNEGVLVWNNTLLKDGGADVTDFETTYKALSNKPSFFLGQFRNKFRNLTGNGTTTVKTGTGVLRGLSLNDNNTGGTVTLYDNTAASGTKIATVKIGDLLSGITGGSSQTANYLPFVAEFTTGLTVVTAGSSSNDITVFYV